MAPNSTWSEEELQRKIGQLFIVGFHGHTPSEDIKALIQKHYVGAIVLFLRNVRDAEQLSALCADLQQLAKDAGHTHPLFIGIDQENGLVTRIKSPIVAQLPGPMALGATSDVTAAYDVALATARNLKYFGVNMNYAPVADINSEPKNPVIGVRSFSDDPEIVSKFVAAQVAGHRSAHVVPCIKHFPGHGDTAVDSHYGLPVINKTKADFEKCELVPFRNAINDGVESIMTAHISIPSMSVYGAEGLPASLNPAIMGFLRTELKYDGMVVSDCLEMDGVRATFGTEHGAVMALKAGTDAVMICHTMAAQVGAIEEVIKALHSGDITQAQIERSWDRVSKLKSKFLVSKSAAVDLRATNEHNSEMAKSIYAKSATVVRTSSSHFPYKLGPDKRIIFLSPGREPLPSGVVEYGEEKTREPYTPREYLYILQGYCPDITSIQYFDTVPMSTADADQVAAADLVILATRNATLSPYQKRMGTDLGQRLGPKLVVVATCDPYDFLESTEVQNYLAIYEPTFPAFQAAVDIIFGAAKSFGKLPVAHPKLG